MRRFLKWLAREQNTKNSSNYRLYWVSGEWREWRACSLCVRCVVRRRGVRWSTLLCGESGGRQRVASTHCSLQDPNITPNLTSLSRSQLARTLSAVFTSQLFSRSVASLLSVVECCTRLFLTLSLYSCVWCLCWRDLFVESSATCPRWFVFSVRTQNIVCVMSSSKRVESE